MGRSAASQGITVTPMGRGRYRKIWSKKSSLSARKPLGRPVNSRVAIATPGIPRQRAPQIPATMSGKDFASGAAVEDRLDALAEARARATRESGD